MAASAQTELVHGMLFGGGSGKGAGIEQESRFDAYSFDYKYNFELGYRFRLMPVKKPFFVDLDLNIGFRNYESNALFVDENWTHTGSGIGGPFIYTAFNPSFNYRIIKGLSAGIGVAPTYARRGYHSFDIPLTAKISYDWKRVGVSLVYRHGLTEVLKSDAFKSGKLREFQAMLFMKF